jgi:hypothetical protein
VPELSAGYLGPLPDARPTGLRRRSVPAGTEIWRVDATTPAKWTWAGFPEPRYRFDPGSGTFRTRYAGATLVGAFRERYRSSGLVIPADHQHHRLVRLVATRNLRVLDLRTEKNLDALRVDDQINTGQHPDVWKTCHRLADAVKRWWTDIDAIVYRSRTTPETSGNFAFFAVDGFGVQSWALKTRSSVLTDLVLHHDFTVNWDIGEA